MRKRLAALALSLCSVLLLSSTRAAASNAGKASQKNTISVGYNYIAAVNTNGSLMMWGDGMYGLCSYDVSPHKTPYRVSDEVASVFSWTAASEGYSGAPMVYTAILRTNGDLEIFGDRIGKLDGSHGTPVCVMTQVAAASAGEDLLAILKTDGTLWTYSYRGTSKVMDHVAAVSTTGRTTAAVKTDGSLWMWGGNRYGQLGNGSRKDQPDPVKVLDNVIDVSVCSSHTAAIQADGTLWMWGDNSYGQLGTHMAGNDSSAGRIIQTVPTKVMDHAASVSVSGSGGHSTHVIKTDGTLWSWGDNSDGQLGTNGAGTRSVPDPYVHPDGTAANGTCLIQDVPAKVLDNVAAVDSGLATTAAVKKDGTLWVTGRPPYEQGSAAKTYVKVLDGIAAAGGTSGAAVGGFSDVKRSDYFADAVLWAVDDGITAGTGGGAFSPDRTCTKAQILTFIWRAAGKPEPTIASPYNDVDRGDYFYDAALWAYEKGLVSGTAFSGGAPCTRSMAVSYLWGAAGKPSSADENRFSDIPTGAAYRQAVAWAVANGITSGTGGNTFSPNSTCTRGQIVTFLYRCRNMRLNPSGAPAASTNLFSNCTGEWYNYTRYHDEKSSMKIENVTSSQFTCEISFYRLTGFRFIGTIDTADHATLFDAESNVNGELTIKGDHIILTLKDIPRVYFDHSLSQFLGGLQFSYQKDRE